MLQARMWHLLCLLGGFVWGKDLNSKTLLIRDSLNLMSTFDDDVVDNVARPDPGKNLTLFSTNFTNTNGTQLLCFQLRTLAHGEDIDTPCSVYDNRGRKLKNYEEIEDGTSVSLVSTSLPFIWQSDKVGEILYVEGGPTEKLIELETISIEPRVYKIRNLITDEEIDEFVQFAKTQKMERSTVGELIKGATGQNLGSLDADRTSENTWDTDSPRASRVQQRVFDLLRVPYDRDWADGFQILHYNPGQFYNSHEDWFGTTDAVKQHRNFEPSLGGANRFATLFLYLSTVEIGGETVFPKGPDVEEDMSTRPRAEELRNQLVVNGTIREGGLEWNLFDTCRRKLHTKPVKGEVILFYNIDSRGVLDAKAQHGACAPLTDDKWGSNLWIWNGPYFLDSARTADFVNKLSEEVHVHWQSTTGDESLLTSLLPGTTYQSFTFVNHTFVVRKDAQVWVFTVQEEPDKQVFLIDNANLKSEL